MLERIVLSVCVLLVFGPHYTTAACSGGTVAGIVLGTMFGTLVVVAVVILVIGLIWRKRNRAAKKGTNATKNAYGNQGFQGDVEMQTKAGQNGTAGNNELPAGYIECREYESPNKDKLGYYTKVDTRPTTTESKARRNLFDEFDGAKRNRMQLDFPMHKTGSHGSLDGAVTPNDPEVISVSLQSQDIIGLGFNISGSMSEGIFVSQVHNRGPASESGQVKVGDRILSIQISMTNMVYEDALTILSYASPYSVRIRLQRAMPFGHDKVLEDETSNINHPVYRSQSLDDLSKISNDKWTGPRKTWSEIKRNHPAKDVVEGKLRKWTNTGDIVHEEVGLTKSSNEESKSSISNLSSDVAFDMIEPETEVLVHHSPSSSAEVVEIDIPSDDVDHSDSFGIVPDLDKDNHGTKRKSTDFPEVSLNINDSGVVADAPPSKRLCDSLSEDEVTSNGDLNDKEHVGLTEKDKLEMIDIELNESSQEHEGLGNEKDVTVIEVSQSSLEETAAFTVGSENESEPTKTRKTSSVSSDGSVSSLSDDSINKKQEDVSKKEEEEGGDSKKLIIADINENKITLDLDKELMEGHLVKSQSELDNVSTQVHPSESFVNQNSSEESEASKDDAAKEKVGKHDDSVRAVLKDYFGDQPNLLEQFGFEEGKGVKGGVVNTVEVTTVTTDGETKTTKTETSVEEVQVKKEVEGSSSGSNARRPKDYHYNTGTKGGMAYYLRFDENFYNDFGLFNHEFNTEKEQPNLVPVPIGDEVLTTSANDTSGIKTDVKQISESSDSSVSMKNSDRVHIVDSDPIKGTFTMEIKSSSDTNA